MDRNSLSVSVRDGSASSLARFAPLLDELLHARGACDAGDSLARAQQHSFVQLGGDSLAAMALAARVQREHGLALSLVDLLGPWPLARAFELAVPAAAGADSAQARPGEAPAAATDRGATPMGQEAMWISELALDGPPHHLVFVAAIDGAVDIDAMSIAVDGLTRRHESLRTALRFGSDGLRREPLDGYRGALQVRRGELDGDDEAAVFAHAHAVGRQMAAARFDHAREPAWRLALVRYRGQRHALVLCAHHLLLDGWAIGLFWNELFARYHAATRGDDGLPGDAEPAPTADALIRWQNGLRQSGQYLRQSEYWRQALDAVPTLIELPSARPRPAIQDSAGERWRFDLGEGLSQRVRAFAAAHGVTAFAALLAGFSLTLKRHTAVAEFSLGVAAPNRPTPQLQALIGLCNNIVPVVARIDESLDAAAHARATQAALAASLANADLAYAEVLQALGAGGEAAFNPYVQIVFSMHDQLIPKSLDAGGARIAIEDGFGGRAPFDLTVFVERGEPAYAGEIEYASAIYDAATVANVFESWRATLQEMTAAPARPLREVRAISPAQRRLLDALNDTARPYRDIAIEAAFAQQAAATPEAIAVEDGELRRSYRQLDRDSAAQARRLRAAGVGAGDHVLIRVERSYAEIVALLGVLRSGASYVALESEPAPARLRAMCAALRPGAIVAAHADTVVADSGATRVEPWRPAWDDEAAAESETDPATAAGTGVDGERIAYVAFTSGTTGTPRGVRVPHRGVLRLVDDPGYCDTGAGQRMLRFAPLAFDASTFEVFAPLLRGGCVVVHPPGLPTPQQLGGFIREHGITVAWLTAGLFRLVADFAPESLAGLRALLAGGDVVPSPQVRRVLGLNPGLRVINGYGPTENTTFTTVHCVDDAHAVADPLPIGAPVPNTTVYVLDECDRELPPGALGELHTGGDGLALDYLDDPAHTAARFGRFSPDVPGRLYRTGDLARIGVDGVVHFHGRRDGQVKIRGHRVELEDLRRAILDADGVHDATARVETGDNGDKRLLVAVVPRRDRAIDDAAFVEALRADLKHRLPAYMQPSRWVVMDALPVTGNGKIDARAFVPRKASAVAADPGDASAAVVRAQPAGVQASPVRGGWQARLAGFFAEVVGMAQVEDEDDFFDLGGDSLRAARLLALIRETWNAEVSLREFYPTPTLAHLTALVGRRMAVAS